MIYSSNTWGIVIATVANFIFGWAWYSWLFGRVWAKLMGFDMSKPMDAKAKSMMMRSMVLNLVTTALTAFVFFSFADNLFLAGSDLFSFALLTWAGFMLPQALGAVLWEGKSWKLLLLNGSQQIIALLISALVYSWLAV